MPRSSTGQTKTFTITFPKLSGVQANVQVQITAGDPDRALAGARQALHQTADQAASGVTVA